MAFSFTDDDFDRIARVLGVQVKRDRALVRYELRDESSGRRVSLEITPNIDLPDPVIEDQPANLVSVYAASSFLQLQGCTGFIASQELGEVIFFARRGGLTRALS